MPKKTLVIGTLGGGSYFSPNHDETTIEVHAGPREAVASMQSRADSNGKYRVHLNKLDGTSSSDYFPTFGDGVYMQCWYLAYHHAMIVEDIIMRGLDLVYLGNPDFTIEFANGTAYVPEDS